jgi:phosphate transport system protein
MKKVLFVCIENSCRSQMAEGFARELAEGVIQAHSAGSNPSGRVNPDAVMVMLEEGVDIGEQKSKGFNDLTHKEFDYIVTMGCGDICPFVPGKRHLDWHIDDPRGKSIEFFRKARDQIREKVTSLIKEIKVEECVEGKIMERHFDDELMELREGIVRMGGLVEKSIFSSVEALKNLSKPEAEKVIAEDRVIDQCELGIDELCLDLLALRQPVAVDLRFITMAMKISTDLERMADLAVDIAQRVLELVDKPLLKPLIDIPRLSVLAQEMTKNALSAFLSSDVALAKQVILCDRDADSLRNLVQSELINDFIIKNKASIPRAIPLLLIARHLERICDHATNIAEDVIYAVEAKVVKHHPEKLQNGSL